MKQKILEIKKMFETKAFVVSKGIKIIEELEKQLNNLIFELNEYINDEEWEFSKFDYEYILQIIGEKKEQS